MAELTIAFVDLTGSVSVFETLGNDRATKAITKLTQWIGSVGVENGGQVVKMLGDGVLLSFASNQAAVDTMMQIQQEHAKRSAQWPNRLRATVCAAAAWGPCASRAGWSCARCFVSSGSPKCSRSS